MERRTAVILGGGKSKRFNHSINEVTDKAIIKIDNKTMIGRILGTTRKAVEEVLIVVRNNSQKERYIKILRDEGHESLNIHIDKKIRCEGPIRGIITGLQLAKNEKVIILPCDIPYIKKKVINYLFDSLENNITSVPIWSNGSLESLITVYDKNIMAWISKLSCWMGKERAQDLIRASPSITFVSVEKNLKEIDPDLNSFFNINYSNDLKNGQNFILGENIIDESFKIESSIDLHRLKEFYFDFVEKDNNNPIEYLLELYKHFLEVKSYFWAASSCEKIGMLVKENSKRQKSMFRKAAKLFYKEGKFYNNRNILFLSAHAFLDEKKCWKLAKNFERYKEAKKRAENVFVRMGWGKLEKST